MQPLRHLRHDTLHARLRGEVCVLTRIGEDVEEAARDPVCVTDPSRKFLEEFLARIPS